MHRILLVDDEADLRGFLRDALTDYDFSVTVARDGAEAIVAAVEQPFDLYLLDMLMPGLDGIRTIQVLRKVTPSVPVLGLTGHLGRGFMAQASALGVTCLSKPISTETLVSEIRELLGAPSRKD